MQPAPGAQAQAPLSVAPSAAATEQLSELHVRGDSNLTLLLAPAPEGAGAFNQAKRALTERRPLEVQPNRVHLCALPCRVRMPTGQYFVAVIAPEGDAQETRIELHQPLESVELQATRTPVNHRTSGLLMTALGGAMVLAGGVLVVADARSSTDRHQYSPSAPTDVGGGALLGVGLFAGGIALGIIGLNRISRTSHPALELKPVEAQSVATLNFNLSPGFTGFVGSF